MDQVKIGQFIKALRKEKNLTQREVAEQLLISEKTVSKWETGNGLPEVSFMKPLCDLLGISLNEFFSGERLDEKQYYAKAEENFMTVGKRNREAEDLLISEYMEKCALRNFIANSEDIDLLRKFYCPEMPIKAIEKMIGDWNSLDYQGKYFEMFAIVRDKKVVGTLSLYEHSRSVVSIGIELFTGCCGKGHGTVAMTRALDICREKGYKIVYQQVRVDNLASMKLHHKVGFETDNYIICSKRAKQTTEQTTPKNNGKDYPMTKKEIEILNPKKLLPWIGAPYMAAGTLEGVILLIGFTPHLLFINYFFEALLLYLFCLSYKNRYKAYKAEPNLKITSYFWIELAIHSLFIAAATVQSALNVWISISEEGLTYRHGYFLSLF